MIKVAGNEYPWRNGMSVLDLLEKIGDSYPYAVVRINDKYVSRPHFAETLVPDNCEVFLIPMIAGG